MHKVIESCRQTIQNVGTCSWSALSPAERFLHQWRCLLQILAGAGSRHTPGISGSPCRRQMQRNTFTKNRSLLSQKRQSSRSQAFRNWMNGFFWYILSCFRVGTWGVPELEARLCHPGCQNKTWTLHWTLQESGNRTHLLYNIILCLKWQKKKKNPMGWLPWKWQGERDYSKVLEKMLAY